MFAFVNSPRAFDLYKAASVLLLILPVACGPTAPPPKAGPIDTPQGEWREQSHFIPLTQDDGAQMLLAARVCRPKSEAPARVVVIAHGTPPLASARATMRLAACENEAVRWFLNRGDLVVLSLRRGYGATGGPYVESSAECSVDAYARAARMSAQDLAATVQYALALPYARPDGAIVVGQSAGGWATNGLNSLPHNKVIAMVSMAGGRGGHVNNVPFNNCRPDNLVTAAGVLGKTATTPMLWIYTANDSYFIPPLAQAMHAAFTAAGGQAELHALPAFAADGHTLFFGAGGSLIWGPVIEHYLAERGAT
jgi:dienelactone hydrolase